MALRNTLLLLIVLGVYAAMASGCAVRYKRALSSNHTIVPGDKANPDANNLEGDVSFQRQEVELLDGSGTICAMLASATDKASARQEALDKAFASETVTYKYRVHQASEFQSVHCGAYYTWGRGDDLALRGTYSYASIAETGRPGRMSTKEGGFRIGSKSALARGLNVQYHLDLGYGSWTFDGLDEPRDRGSALDDMNAFGLSRLRRTISYYRAAIDVQIQYRPEWAWGLGFYGHGAVDAFAFKKPDLGAGLNFIAPIAKNLIVSVELGWGERNRGDKSFYSVRSRELLGSLMLLSRF